ncbi:cytochrome P450 [Lindgomyces ingoldianus]|uniref:Cytochrome P450 n=1 Tax=Lindgomyces ingoldianus TaxID=673940 RepID=A0ACB6QC32_9PLEO|nr:cytochrome P450 [Lindgomyces ingoldianus]KAF2464462.1 cytochrome P450 [Lindgomyces ingoldianus]
MFLELASLVKCILYTWNRFLLTPAVGCVLLLLWRIWRFTVLPVLRPNEPKELPYWIPVFGHTIAFFGNSDKLLERGLNYTGRTHEVFAIQVFRKKLYIITNPSDVSNAFRDNEALHFDGHLNELLCNWGFEGEALRLAWHVPQPGEWCYLPGNPLNPNHLSLNRFTEEVYREQLLPGPKMDAMYNAFATALFATLEWSNLDFCTVGVRGKSRLLSLSMLCRHTMVDATTRSMFGSHLHRINPTVVENMMNFNDHAWMVFFRYPEIFGSPVTEPRRQLMDTLKTFINLPAHARTEQAWSIDTILKWQEIMGVDLHSRASIILMIYWAANSNEYNISFWVLAHLLHSPDLFRTVYEETEAAWPHGKLDIKWLCTNAPNLDAIFSEALRLNGGAMVSRVVRSPITLGGKVLQPGHSALIPARQLHMNEKVWGDNVAEFDATRFKNKKSLTRHSSYRPFGGGVTYCPGRVLAKEEVFSFLAILFHRFDIKLAVVGAEKQKFPKLDDSTPALGITGPVRSMDVIIETTLKNKFY